MQAHFFKQLTPYFLKTVAFFRRRKKLRRFTFATVASLLLFVVLHLGFPLPDEIPYSQVITSREGTVLNAFLSADDKWRMKTELSEITPEVETAFIEKEDQYFYYHFGINPFAVVRAAFNNMVKGKKTSGASTITMQVARLLEPKERTYWGKLIEMFRALQLELKYSKREILQLYLNLAPYGGNIEGVKAASLLYFGKLPEQLSLAQVTVLTIIPNRPTSLALGRNNPLIRQERDRWLNRFKAENIFPAQDIEDALAEPFNVKRNPVPAFAPHFASLVHRLRPESASVQTTLQVSVQDKVEEIALAYSRNLKRFGIYNASVVVAENTTGNIVAYLGSPDFNDGAHGGQVDGVRAYRSPGSALKPLVYALGFDAGVVTPKTVVYDVPVDFNGYAPENYDEQFHGSVTIEQALATSLNIPAVRVLEQVRVNKAVEALKKAGFRHISKDEQNLGLSLALGGCGVSVIEMTGLYSTLANGGVYSPLRIFAEDSAKTQQKIELISPAAAFVITEILTKVERPELPSNYEDDPHIPKIAWKTGTSYGRRDAWSIGFNKKYTIAVWVGNFNGEGVPELTGAAIATPLLFKLFNTIDYNSPNDWFTAPEELQTRMVCTESGLPPSDFCENMTNDAFIPGLSTAVRCSHLKYMFVSPKEDFSYCTTCLPESGYKQKLYSNLSPEMIDFNETHQIAYAKVPPHNPKCNRIFEEDAPVIVSPMHGREYLTDNDEGVELMLKCNAANDVKKVFWYVNNRFYKTALATERVFFKPQRGQLRISCSDDKGRNTNIDITVK